MKYKPAKAMDRIADPKVRERLEKGHTKVPGPKPDPCHVWNGQPNERGYCKMKVAGKDQYVHRVSYAVHKGDIPEKMTVDHQCHNTKCMNPGHLELVSHSVNSQLKKGCRHASDQSTECSTGTPGDDVPVEVANDAGPEAEQSERDRDAICGASHDPVHEAQGEGGVLA